MVFGTGSRSELGADKEVRGKPGPGEHSPEPYRTQTAAPKYKFGTGVRSKESKLFPKTPGPGTYLA